MSLPPNGTKKTRDVAQKNGGRKTKLNIRVTAGYAVAATNCFGFKINFGDQATTIVSKMTPSDAILDFDLLLAPISPENPCGESLRWDPLWDELSQLRKTRKDPLDSSGDKEPEWGRIVSLSTKLLATRTKDLLIAGWLTEALVREKGFAGFRDGLKLINGLIQRFWDGLHPLPEDQDQSIRAAPLSWLTSRDGGARMPVAMREISLTSLLPPQGEQILNWNFWHLRRASPQSKDEKEDAYKRRLAEAEQKRQIFDSTVEALPITVYQRLLADMDACLEEINRVAASLETRLPPDLTPDWTKLRESIEEIRVFVYGVLKRRGGLPAVEVPAEVPTEESGMPSNQANVAVANNGAIRSRADAIRRLDEAAKYFSETEPHSPVAHLVRRAIRWAGMPFEDVLAELIKDDKLVKQISETLGISSGPTK